MKKESEFARALKKLLSSHNMKQKELANKINVTEATISRYLNGIQLPRFDLIEAIAKVFNVSPTMLLSYENYEKEYQKDQKEKYEWALKHYGVFVDQLTASKIKEDSSKTIEDSTADTFIVAQAWIEIFKTYFSRSLEANDFDSSHPNFEKYVSMLLYQEHFRNRIDKEIYSTLVSRYGKNYGLSEGRTIYEITNYNKNPKTHIPVLGRIPAGIPIEAIEDILDYEDISEDLLKSGYEYFGLKVQGKSMEPKYNDGDILIIRKCDTCENGTDAIVMVNGNDATFKRFYKTEDGVTLQPLNSEFQPYFYSPEQVKDLPVRVIGIPIEIRRKI